MAHHRWWLAPIAVLALLVVASGSVLGYAGEVAKSVTVSRPSGTLKCGVNTTITATVLDAAGKPIAEQPVSWSWVSKVSSSDQIKTPKSTTNAQGIAKTTVNLACVPGSRVLRATADAVKGQVVLNVTAGGLPRTSTLAAVPTPAQPPLVGTLLAILALASGCGLALRGALARR